MKYEMSDIGKYTLAKQEELAETYKYKVLENNLALNCMRHYVTSLPKGFCLKHPGVKVIDNPEIDHCIYKPGFEIHKEHKLPIVSRDGTMIAYTYNRIVIGHYGAFIEMKTDDIYEKNIKIKRGQEYRVIDRKYRDKVKYQWFTTKDESDCKLYKQMREVAYADYITGKWYISPFEILDEDELKSMFMSEGEGENEKEIDDF